MTLPPSGGVRRHFTASAFVTDGARSLLLLHRTKHLWLPPGGHVEPDEPPAAAAIREVWEETGLHVEIVSPAVPAGEPRAAPRPEACLEIEITPGHVHLDLVYFARPAPGQDPMRLRPNEESADLRWWTAEELRAGRASGIRAGFLPADVVSLALMAMEAQRAPASGL